MLTIHAATYTGLTGFWFIFSIFESTDFVIEFSCQILFYKKICRFESTEKNSKPSCLLHIFVSSAHYKYSINTELGIRSFAHRLFAHFAQIKWATVSDSHRSSRRMSDREQIAQVAQRKWATVSELLRLLRGNERPQANYSGCSRQMSDSLRSLRGNDPMSDSLKKVWLNNLKSCFSMFYKRLKNERPRAIRSFAHFWTKSKQFAWKSNERIPSPV